MKHKVLFVDDDKNILNTLKMELNVCDFEPLFSNSGKDALRILGTEVISIIVSDLKMPEMDGFEFLQKSWELYPDTIRIVLSSYSDIDKVVESIERGNIYRYITKPWDIADLKLVVQQSLGYYELLEEKKELSMKIEEQNEELKKWNSTLEKKVNERTKQVKEKHRKLERAYNELKRVDKLKDDFTDLILYKFKTPLSTIVSKIETLKSREFTTGNENDHFYETIYSQAKKINQTLEDIISISKFEAGFLKYDFKVDVSKTVKNVTNEFMKKKDKHNKIFDTGIIILIIINIVALILESISSIYIQFKYTFNIIEVISVFIFSFEYIFRILNCGVLPKYKRPIMGRLKFILTPLLIIDLLALVSFYLPIIIGTELQFLKILRVLRLFRIFQIGRCFASLNFFIISFKSKKEELLITFIVLIIMLLISSTIMFYFENTSQPDKFSSIPASLWWGVASLTTIGYGDIYPITIVGKIFASIISVIGIGFIALPTGILSSAFIEQLQTHKKG